MGGEAGDGGVVSSSSKDGDGFIGGERAGGGEGGGAHSGIVEGEIGAAVGGAAGLDGDRRRSLPSPPTSSVAPPHCAFYLSWLEVILSQV
jgi:hypothetical protein